MENEIMNVEETMEEVIETGNFGDGFGKGAVVGAAIVFAGYALYKGGKLLWNKIKTAKEKKPIEGTFTVVEDEIENDDYEK